MDAFFEYVNMQQNQLKSEIDQYQLKLSVLDQIKASTIADPDEVMDENLLKW